MTLPICFVIQPFDDGGKYDLRYQDHIVKAIKAAGYTSIRGDTRKGPEEHIPKRLEQLISECEICLADISEEKINIGYELGYARAKGKPTVLICQKDKRRDLPFDIATSNVILYEDGSGSNLGKLEQDIIDALNEYKDNKPQSPTPTTPVSQLGSFPEDRQIKPRINQISELVLITIARNGINESKEIRKSDLQSIIREKQKYNLFMMDLAIKSLIDRGLLCELRIDGVHAYSLTFEGERWCRDNPDKWTTLE